ncbi:hypothetical protein TW65_03653 [Stemphylium lycopersici]|nr:hypothetical protein TW65_03653 [Stemphylium lycopersici]
MDPFNSSRLVSPLSCFLLVLVGIAVVVLKKECIRKHTQRESGRDQNLKTTPTTENDKKKKKTTEPDYSEASYYAIEPLEDFSLETQEPLELRPFKPKFHMTMDLVAMDNSYITRLHLRRQLIQDQRREVLACNPQAIPAVLELYEWLIGTYLPRRFPGIYSIVGSNSNDTEKTITNQLLNTATSQLLPLRPLPTAEHALQILGENIDTEFLLLQKPPVSPSQLPSSDPYRLTAFLNCFPSGFSTLSKLGLTLAAIHAPVPHYSAKLEKSMDRYFASLPVGKIVKRINWSVDTNGELFCLKGNHMSEEDLVGKGEQEVEAVDVRKTMLRCERQTLHRLPRTGALVFAFKTYMYPLQQLKDQGNGELLAEAIDGLGLGSAPKMTVYKRQVIWGERVKAFLRGEIDA